MKEQLSIRIDTDVLNDLRNVVYWKPGMTLNVYVENALKEALSKEPEILQRPSELRSGAPIR